ncbi:MAG: lytic transglycosylase domain-containing protein [Desulfuromonadales bacterium]|nr:lytic transglycosylase domain-containing protein [Desulfuromonadales bacterium]
MSPVIRLTAILLALLLPATASGFCFEEAGTEYGISPLLLWGIARHESGMNPAAIGKNGNGTYDYGLMQINSRWAKVVGLDNWHKLGDPCTNVRTGAWILAQCIQRNGYNWKAVGCYHSNTPGRRERYAGRIATIIADIGTAEIPSQLLSPNLLDSLPNPWTDVFGKPLY